MQPAIEKFIYYLRYERNASPATIGDYRCDIEQFRDFLTPPGESTMALDQVDHKIVREFVSGRMLAELAGVPSPDWFVCCSVTGWLNEAGLATGMKRLSTHHSECRARGKGRCTWELRWDGGRSPTTIPP